MPTLYVKEQGAVLAHEDGRITARKAGAVLADVPMMHVERMVLMGNVHLTTPLTSYLLDRQVDTVFLSCRGRYKGRLQPSENSHVALRRCQYRASDSVPWCLDIARRIVAAKLRNQASLIGRRRGVGTEAAETIRARATAAMDAASTDVLMGIEGVAARSYFAALGQVIQGGFSFTQRMQHPPPDPINAMLSLGYSMLYGDMLSALYVVGFDPYVGVLHQERRGHAVLASDLMEEFRAAVVDVVVLSLCNRRMIVPGDFARCEKGVRLKEDALKLFFAEYERRMETRVAVASSGDKRTYRGALEQQARCLAGVLLGEREEYVPFQMRQ